MSRHVTRMTIHDVDHYTDEERKTIIATFSPHERDAREKGIPTLGAGAIYPVAESEFVIDPIIIPPHWARCYALDVGWNRTAAVWGAWDREADVIYLYTEHYRGQAEPSIHATAIKARGEWIPGVIDPAANGRSQDDGEQLIATYRALDLNLEPANNAVEAGIYNVWERLSTGRLKVFSSLLNWCDEYRQYHRDEDGKIVKKFDHLMDATRYLVTPAVNAKGQKTSGLARMAVEIPKTHGFTSGASGDASVGY